MNWLRSRKASVAGISITIFALLFSSCGEKKKARNLTDDDLQRLANELVHKFGIVDGHVDLPTVLYEKKFKPGRDADTILHTGKGNFDYDRAVKGGLTAPFMSIYIPASYQRQPDNGKALADTLMQLVKGIAATMPDRFALANTPSDVEKNFAAHKISLPMGMENGAPIGNHLTKVHYFYDQGIRYITLTHTKDNQICDSSGDTTHTWNGLSPFGAHVVQEMNRTGIMVDISHVDDSTFYQVLALTKIPCIASHSSCRHFSPRARRDMTDDMIRKMGANDGVILVNFFNAFLDSTFYDRMRSNEAAFTALLASKSLKAGDPAAKALRTGFNRDHPLPKVDIAVVADHIDHIVQLIGVDHVGLGSDFDGVDDLLPAELTDVSMYPNLIFVLLKRGYSEDDIEKICGTNFKRVWQRVLDAREK